METYNMTDLEKRALEAVKNEKIKDSKDSEDRAEECLQQYKDIFPELTRKGDRLFLEGHEFRAYPTGYYMPSYKTSYSLDPILRRGHWIYNLASFGRYLIWYKEIKKNEQRHY